MSPRGDIEPKAQSSIGNDEYFNAQVRELREGMQSIFPIDAYPKSMRGPIAKMRRSNSRARTANRLGNVVYYGGLILFAGWIFAQVIDRTPPVDTTLSLLTLVIHPGDEVKFAAHSDKHRACQLTLSWVMTDGIHEVRPFSYDPIPPVDVKAGPIVKDPILGYPMWSDAAPGDGTIRFSRAYVCPGNYLHNFNPIVVTTEVYHFKIVPKGVTIK